MTSKTPTRFGLLRHGKTVWNLEKRIQGSGNSPLTTEGISECRRWATYLSTSSPPWQHLLVSPLQRTVETAHILNEKLQLPIYLEEGLREQDWGLWEGLTVQDIKRSFPGELEKRVKHGWNFRPPEGECRQEVLERATGAIRIHSDRRPGENILIVTHLGVIKSLLYSIEGREFLPREPKIVWKHSFHIISCFKDNLTVEESNINLPEIL